MFEKVPLKPQFCWLGRPPWFHADLFSQHSITSTPTQKSNMWSTQMPGFLPFCANLSIEGRLRSETSATPRSPLERFHYHRTVSGGQGLQTWQTSPCLLTDSWVFLTQQVRGHSTITCQHITHWFTVRRLYTDTHGCFNSECKVYFLSSGMNILTQPACFLYLGPEFWSFPWQYYQNTAPSNKHWFNDECVFRWVVFIITVITEPNEPRRV